MSNSDEHDISIHRVHIYVTLALEEALITLDTHSGMISTDMMTKMVQT